MSDAPSPALVELAASVGVATEYWDWKGQHVRVSVDTLRSVLQAMEIPCADDQEAASSLAARQLVAATRPLPPVVVVREGAMARVPVRLPHGASLVASCHLETGAHCDLQQVEHNVPPLETPTGLIGEAMVEVPAGLPLGYHEMVVHTGDTVHSAPVIVVPERLELPADLHDGPALGVAAQLYQVRGERSWGIGDVSDLIDLGAYAVGQGADFVLINPVHAAEAVPPIEPSPYLPSTRRFMSLLYLRIEDIPEVGYLSPAARAEVEALAAQARALNVKDSIERDPVYAAKLAALRIIFAAPRRYARAAAYDRFVSNEGQGLLDYATWCALSAELGPVWQAWPEEYHDPASPAVVAYRDANMGEVAFHAWTQWLVQEQVGHAHRALRRAGMRVGVMHDLAVGVHPSGADAWALRSVLARGVSVGAPPDHYSQMGQDWSQPPWRPDLLPETGYAPYRNMVRTALQSAGGLRADHVLGLFRLWWVPEGRGPQAGTYVRYDHEALVGILCLEAARSGAVVVGEDLGTVEPWVRDYLRERGVLGTSIVWFERDEHGMPLPPSAYRELCLASVNTHDLPPTAGYLRGEHIRLRHELGLSERDMGVEMAEDEAVRDSYLELLRDLGLLREGATPDEQVEALHAFLTLTPARLRCVSLADMVGDRRAINQPGTFREYSNWSLPLSGPDGQVVSLADVVASPTATALLRAASGVADQPR